MSSADVALVTARNKSTSIAAAPDEPNSAAAADGAGSPAETSAVLNTRISGSFFNATAANPSVVANVNGIANLTANGELKERTALVKGYEPR